MAPAGPLLAIDTATDVAALGLVEGASRTVLAAGEAAPVSLLAEADVLLEQAGLGQDDLAGVVVGIGPGRYTSMRIGLASARAVATALGVPIAGVSTLAALAAGAPDAVPLIDARRGEVFTHLDGDVACLGPTELDVDGATCVGDGATAYRDVLEKGGALVPEDGDPRHRISVAELVGVATAFGDASDVVPLYMRAPDAERTRKEFPRA